MSDTKVNGFANRETFVALSWMLNDENLIKQIVTDLFHTGVDFDSINSVAYEIEHWFYNYFHPWHWRENLGQEMPYEAIVMLGDIGSLWRIEWKELAPGLMSEAKDILGEDFVSDEEVGLMEVK